MTAFDIEIVDKMDNRLFSRTELSGTLSFQSATPSRPELLKALSEKLKVPPERIVIRKIGTMFGSRSARFEAAVYEKAEGVSIERPHLLMRGKPKEKGEGGAAKEDAKDSG